MKSRKRNLLLYLIAVIIPTLAGSIFFFMDSVKQNDEERLEEAKWIGSIHQRSWDQFISETVTTLDMLSLTAGSADTPSDKLEPLLQKPISWIRDMAEFTFLIPAERFLQGPINS
ncbi:hypothetical protein M5V91_13090 [Cytobacillus pseudoceanisediminis]|uniref:hypothetical protein n=1 Tax=Cytobacillus pseudoceanisediminis TaxID=3051614 RepID=UPI002185F575|nr:hypothetical protein [Cytobacillus pseudoceanisediminis]UQX56425.1 hypothetical protein M5V91_13090 [Cytobacillus pseudoceanisediminis]